MQLKNHIFIEKQNENRAHRVKGHRPHNKKSHTHSVFMVDQLAYQSGMRMWSGEYKMGLAIGSLVFCVGANRVVSSMMVFLVMSYLILVKANIHVRTYGALLSVPFSFLVLGIMPILFEVARQPLGKMTIMIGSFYVSVTGANCGRALRLFCRAFSAVSALYMLALSTPMSEMIEVLGKWRVPKLFVELMYFVYRFIFVLTDTEKKMRVAAKSRSEERRVGKSVEAIV